MRPAASAAFLSEDWFGRARDATAALEPQAGIDCRVQFQAGDRRWLQVVHDGRIERWGPGELADPDVEVHWSLADAFDIACHRLRDSAALAVTTIASCPPDPPFRGPAPPMDLPELPGLTDMARIPEADVTVQHRLRAGPFGDVEYVQSFVDGRHHSMALGRVEEPDIELEIPYRSNLLLRHGEITVLQALESGTISGSVGALGVLAGILESETYQQVRRRSPRVAGLALAALGELDARPGYRAAMTELARDTVAP